MIKYIVKDNNIIIEDIHDFDLGQTLECGQAFHFEKTGEQDYIVVAMNRMLHVAQTTAGGKVNLIFYNTSAEDFENVWNDYFDFDTDYAFIKSELLKMDERLREAIDSKWGVHILNQDFFEMLMSFIISQNKQIPQIKELVFRISKFYGKKLGEYNGKAYYSFPDVNECEVITEEDFRNMKTGFRAPYLYDAAKKCKEGMYSADILSGLNDDEVMEYLKQIKGVGEKVASCVMLFGLGRRSAFPVDVWMKRIMERLYFGEDTKKEVIMEFAKKRFGELGGYAQQYLFYFARDGQFSQ